MRSKHGKQRGYEKPGKAPRANCQVLDGGNAVIEPLSEGGRDCLESVVALCPNCHRQVHYGTNRDELNRRLLSYVTEIETRQ